MSNKLIDLIDISKSYGMQTVLDELNLYIRENEFLTLLGPSGCGKTTTLRILGGFETPDKGRVIFDGQDITNFPANKRQLNTVFQKYALFTHMNIADNIAFGLKLKRIKDPKTGKERKLTAKEIDDKVLNALKIVDLEEYEDRDVTTLSGGQQQRVAIARAIVNEPEILLLDEPLGALDLKMRKDMQLELKQMHKKLGITFIYVTHDQEEALTMSDIIVVMKDGQIQQIGTPTDIYNEPKNAFVADFIGESNIYNATYRGDKKVRFLNHLFDCVDEGFDVNEKVDVVVRPEDIELVEVGKGMVDGKIVDKIFKGIHYQYVFMVGKNEVLIQDTRDLASNVEASISIKPDMIHIMKKERVCNTFEGKLLDATHVEFLGCNFECVPVEGIAFDTNVKVEVDFEKVILQDNEEDGTLTGEVKFILYKGDHYHLTVLSDWDENVFVDTNDVWDDGDRVGITIPPDAIRIVKITD